MIIDAAGGVTNTGTIEATGGATLELTNTGSTAEMEIINTGGTISANASTLIVSGATINGGAVTLTGAATLELGGSTIEGVTLTNSATGTIEAGGFNTLEGTINNPAGGTIEIDHTGLLTLAGNISNKGTINDGGYLTLASNVSNAGTINLAPVGGTTSTAELLVDGDITLSGGGKLTMSNNVNNFIISVGAGLALLNNEETISGAGQIGAPALGTGPLTLVNSGTINANASAGMTIEAGGGVTNTGTIEATGGATLQLVDDGAARVHTVDRQQRGNDLGQRQYAESDRNHNRRGSGDVERGVHAANEQLRHSGLHAEHEHDGTHRVSRRHQLHQRQRRELPQYRDA